MNDVTGIIIVNYNTFSELTACIDSIEKNVACEYKIYIVDNGSEVSIKDSIFDAFTSDSNVNILSLDDNFGYSGGNNAGIVQAQKDGCKYIAIVNSDICFKNDVITILKKDLKGNIGIAGPYVENLDGENGQHLLRTYTYLSALTDRHPFFIIKKAFKIGFIEPQSIHGATVFEGMVSGCCFLTTAGLLQDVENFDDNVFLYSEERILSLKFKDKGIKCIYDPDAKVLHKEGKSTVKKGSAFADYHRYISDYYTVKKYLKPNVIQMLLYKNLRKLVFKIKADKNPSYKPYYLKLKNKMSEIDSGNYKIKG